MENYKLTIEDGVITCVENADENGNPIEGILYIPKEAVAFRPDAWVFLGCEAEEIVVDPENEVFSSAYNALHYIPITFLFSFSLSFYVSSVHSLSRVRLFATP